MASNGVLVGEFRQGATRGRLFVRAEFRAGGELSVCGDLEEIRGSRWRDVGGRQCGGMLTDPAIEWLPGSWSRERRERAARLWDRWHLNHMRPCCAHQRELGWLELGRLRVEVVSYGLTTEAYRMREAALAKAATAALRGEPLHLTPTARALAELEDWFKDRHAPPDADSPLSGCFEVKKREVRPAFHVYPSEHPCGLLTLPCPVCGYPCGSAWLREEIPAGVRFEIAQTFGVSLPEGDPARIGGGYSPGDTHTASGAEIRGVLERTCAEGHTWCELDAYGCARACPTCKGRPVAARPVPVLREHACPDGHVYQLNPAESLGTACPTCGKAAIR